MAGSKRKANVLWKERIQASERQGNHSSDRAPDQQRTEVRLNVRWAEFLHNLNRGPTVKLPARKQLKHIQVLRRHWQDPRQNQPDRRQNACFHRGHQLRSQPQQLLFCGLQTQILRRVKKVLHPNDQASQQFQHHLQTLF